MSNFKCAYKDGVYYDEQGDQFVTISTKGNNVVLQHCKSGKEMETFPRTRFDPQHFTQVPPRVVHSTQSYIRKLLRQNEECRGPTRTVVGKYLARYSIVGE